MNETEHTPGPWLYLKHDNIIVAEGATKRILDIHPRPDHPLIRRNLSCPLCNAYKSGGKVVCWECHIELESGSDDERDYTETQLDDAERRLELNEAWGIW